MKRSNFDFLIVGTNFISDNFTDAVRRLDGVGISAVLSRRKETGEAFAARSGAERVFTSLNEACAAYEEGAFDAVYIASPNALHIPQSEYFLGHGINVLCEKPAAADEISLEAAIAAAERSGAVFAEAMRPAHDPAIARIRSALGEIGPIRSARFEFTQYSSRYDRFLAGERVNTFDRTLGNAALLDLGVYAISCALMIFGEPQGEIVSRSAFLDCGFEASGNALLSYPGFVLSVVYSKVCASGQPSVIVGERGSIEIDRLSAVNASSARTPCRITWYTRSRISFAYAAISAIRGKKRSTRGISTSRARSVACSGGSKDRPASASTDGKTGKQGKRRGNLLKKGSRTLQNLSTERYRCKPFSRKVSGEV